MLCEKGMIIVEARNALSVPQNIKQAAPQKTQNNTRKIDKYCTNCGMTTFNVKHEERIRNRPQWQPHK